MTEKKKPVVKVQPDGLLKFSLKGNAKLDKRTASFSLPAGYSCPGAVDCLTKANRDTGVIKDGPKQTYRCFSASQEAAFPAVRRQRWHNYDLVRDAKFSDGIYRLLLDSLPADHRWGTMRIHVGGDFYNLGYYAAWMAVAKDHPDKAFYAYTKSAPIVRKWLERGGKFPDNFTLTSSSDEIEGAGRVEVVFHPDEAAVRGLPVDHDDSHAMKGTERFALLLHGTQPKGSPASRAKSKMDKEKIKYSYPNERNKKQG